MPKERSTRNHPIQHTRIADQDLAVDIPTKFRWNLLEEQPSGRFILKNLGHGQETTLPERTRFRAAVEAVRDRRELAREAYDRTRDTEALNKAAESAGMVQRVSAERAPTPTPLLAPGSFVPARNYYSRTPIPSPSPVSHQEMEEVRSMLAVASALVRTLSASPSRANNPSQQ
jgi:hypothetical protein